MEDNNNNLEINELDGNSQQDIIKEMYKDYFLDYASYVILERAIPAALDGLKPVQRRILHSMFTMDDGRFHKVANVIGQTMQYHPHGDAAIGDALVVLGQKNLLIDCQGNWGDVRTGDRSAAPRYIEARLSKFALEIAFNPKTTHFQFSYDGRKKEPLHLPVKFPLLLAQGVEGIAVGLSTKILPHNFVELIKASIDILKGKKTNILPDFPTGGQADFSNYNSGKRGGKVRVRAKIEIVDKKHLKVVEIPYGTTTTSLIDSIIKANNKSKIKIKKVVDNTAAEVEVLIEIPSGASPEVTIDALYAFTDCEVSISPNNCTILDDTPVFTTVDDLLETCTFQTKDLLKWELEIKKKELEEKWHFASLEKIFIENKIYSDIEECESWEEVIEAIDEGLKPHIKHLHRAVTEEDIVRLTEIKIKRISKFNKFKADELLRTLEEELEEVKNHLANLIEFCVAYFKNLLKKYGKGKERKTEIATFGTINAAAVVVNNAKLYVNRKDGFVGYGLKKDEFIQECSDIDNVIVFHKDGSYQVVKIAEKVFVGKNPIHIAVWKKKDERTTYNMVYADLEKGVNYAKRFHVSSITRERKYPVATKIEKSKLLHFSANPNGEAEVISVQLTQSCSAKKKDFDFDFADLAIKGRTSRGNIITKYPIRKIKVTEQGTSTLAAIRVWFDDTTGRINSGGYGRLLGAFEENDRIIALYQDGSYELTDYELIHRFDTKKLLEIKKWEENMVISAIYWDSDRSATYVKRFVVETSKLDQIYSFLPDEGENTKLLFASLFDKPVVEYKIKAGRSKSIEGQLEVADFIDVKGWKSIGNKLSDSKLSSVKSIHVEKELTEADLDNQKKKKNTDDAESEEDQPKLF